MRLLHSRYKTNCDDAAFSRSLERNGRVVIGLKFLRSSESEFLVFEIGDTLPCLNNCGNIPDCNERSTI